MLKRRRRADRSTIAATRQPAGNPRRWTLRSKLVAALVTAGALGFSLLFVLEIAAERGGHSLDPTDPMNFNSYALRNDSQAALHIHRCADPSCAQLEAHSDWIIVQPGTAAREQVYWGETIPVVYAVASNPSTAGGRRCLVLNAATKASATVDAPLSSARHC